MKTCFSEGKLMKQFEKPALFKRTPLSTNLLFLSNLFMTPSVQIAKTSPPLPNFRGEETKFDVQTRFHSRFFFSNKDYEIL